MMGLPNWLHWSAWFFKSYLFILISLIFITAILKIKWYPDNPELAVLTYMDGTVLFVFFLIYAFSMVTLSFFVSTLFSTGTQSSNSIHY
jgi:ATP-binding cassette subfamily A (ABC1) protein 3